MTSIDQFTMNAFIAVLYYSFIIWHTEVIIFLSNKQEI